MQLHVETDVLLGVGSQIRGLAGDVDDVAGVTALALATAAAAAGDAGVAAAADEFKLVATTARIPGRS